MLFVFHKYNATHKRHEYFISLSRVPKRYGRWYACTKRNEYYSGSLTTYEYVMSLVPICFFYLASHVWLTPEKALYACYSLWQVVRITWANGIGSVCVIYDQSTKVLRSLSTVLRKFQCTTDIIDELSGQWDWMIACLLNQSKRPAVGALRTTEFHAQFRTFLTAGSPMKSNDWRTRRVKEWVRCVNADSEEGTENARSWSTFSMYN